VHPLAGFSELIKNFEKTRDYLRDFFIYGFKTRGEFSGRSSRTYDDEKRRAESWLTRPDGSGFFRCEDTAQGRLASICADSGHLFENPLYQAYQSRSFTDNDIRLHFLLCDLLTDAGAVTLREIMSGLDERCAASGAEMFEEQTVRNKLREYAAEGLILTEKRGKTACFRLSPDTVSRLFAETEGLAEAVQFFSEDAEFGVIGNSLLKAAGMKNTLFLHKHHYIVHTLEDDILTVLLTAITEQREVSFRNFGAARRLLPQREGEQEGGLFTALPMQIFVSVQTGRRYLAAYVPANKRFVLFRLDFIRRVRIGSPSAAYPQIAEKFRRNRVRCFGVSFGMRRENEPSEPLKLTVRVNPQTEAYVLERLRREKRCGTLEQVGEQLFQMTFDVHDPNEVMQWTKTLIGRIVRAEGGTPKLRARFQWDIRRMQRMYGAENDEHIQ